MDTKNSEAWVSNQESWAPGFPSATGMYDVRVAFEEGSQPAYFYAPTQAFYKGWFDSESSNEIHRLQSVIAWKRRAPRQLPSETASLVEA